MNFYRVYLSLIFFCVAIFASAQMADPADYLEFETKNIDLGEIIKGQEVTLYFSFKNVYDKPIEIDFISTCDCTEAEWTLGEILPGHRGTISAVFDTNTKESIEEIELLIQLKNIDSTTDTPVMDYLSYVYTFK